MSHRKSDLGIPRPRKSAKVVLVATIKIFINYRREDEPGFVQALFIRLEQAFEPERLFMDVDNIPPGRDFDERVGGRLAGTGPCSLRLRAGRLRRDETDRAAQKEPGRKEARGGSHQLIYQPPLT